MNILIIGNTAREHALTWKLAKSKDINKIFVISGNAGTAIEPNTTNVLIDMSNIEKILEFSKENNIELAIVNDEDLLNNDIVSSFREYNIPCLGPTQKTFQLEDSQVLSKNLINKHQIPTISYRVFDSAETAKNYAGEQPYPLIVKQNNSHSIESTIIAHNVKEANEIINRLFAGEDNQKVIIEQILQGEEVSVTALTDGKSALSLGISKVYKRYMTQDRGIHTSGMGIISPAQDITDELEDKINTKIMQQILNAIQKEKLSYYGFISANVIITDKSDVKLVNFSLRLGDPEASAIFIRMKSDLLPLLIATTNKSLHLTQPIVRDTRCSLGVTVTNKTYPNPPATSENIFGTINTPSRNCKIFHAGTKTKNNETYTAGSKVFCVVALGDDILRARRQAYALVNHINWKNKYFRHDIGYIPSDIETEN